MNGRLLLVPPEVVTVVFQLRGVAVAMMRKSAVMVVGSTTMTLVTVTALPWTFTVAGEVKFVPVNVTCTVAPCAPDAGFSEIRVGADDAPVTVKVCAPLVPADVATVTFLEPTVAPAAIWNVAVIWVGLTTTTLDVVTPEPLTATVAPAMKFVPVKVTDMLAPCAPLEGETELNTGGPPPSVVALATFEGDEPP